MISIILPTMRVGGLDVVADSLRRQTFTDFELIIADGIYRFRRPHVADQLGKLPFPVMHMASGGIELSNYSRAINDAVAVARGDTILILPDFAWLSDECLEVHARFHDEHRGQKVAAMAEYSATAMPEVHPDYPGYHPSLLGVDASQLLADPDARYEAAMTAEADRYLVDLEAGKLDSVMWSLWHEPLSYEAMMALPVTHFHQLWDTFNPDGTTGVAVDWGPNHASLKNESTPVELWEDANGLDEDLDGSHLYQDRAFSLRIVRNGWRWHRLRGGTVRIIDPRGIATCKRALRPMRSNGAIADAVEAGAKKPVNPGWSMKQRRLHV